MTKKKHALYCVNRKLFPSDTKKPPLAFTVIVCNVPIIYMSWFLMFILNHFFCFLYPVL